MNKLKVIYEDGANRITVPRKGDVGIDIYCNADVTLTPGKTSLIPTGMRCKIPEHFAAILKDRSGKSKYYHVLAGVIDSSYTGEWKVRVLCHTPTEGLNTYRINKGDKIAQAILIYDLSREVEIEEVSLLEETERGESGFGSTGN